MQQEAQLNEARWGNLQVGLLAGDLAAAAASASLVTPAVAIIDRSLVEQAAFKQPILHGLRRHTLRAFRQPGLFVFQRPFGIVWALYAATYSVANVTDTISRKLEITAAGTITFATTMMANVPLALWKDIRFAQEYGTGRGPDATKANIPNSVPLQNKSLARAAAAIFLVRDGVTIFGSFTLAPWLSDAIPDGLAAHFHAKPIITQLTVPVLTQLVATPLHLLALDMYTRQYTMPLLERVKHSQQYLPSSALLRCIRIIPAFGIGCLTNMELRCAFHARVSG
ncbi:uncharacterized protein N7479_007002 [Penicillium vulpinum]|uniref:Uncharacterized protein n=1 Tax=Penicillium vulpinum TaxID=29845 RepID=A0A1V6S2V9_9EURO|nr:uncharacterized protein N7479_007002 [Penicillium vulpinum]KAJ5959852.1 hypothetical protein N7479_007002 [Penicillium vulpinum]OQE08385.1 hypothetical protein PENVUL_c010G08271 [Penicillium vulpinum]